MPELVKIVECPRDAWQGLQGHIPADVKAEYLRRLVDTGFRHIDAVSFVSPATLPQMADSEEVLKMLGPVSGVEIIGIVVNAKGAERAIRSGGVHTLGFPYSISTRFLERNQHQTPEQALQELKAIKALAKSAEVDVVVYISMAFGNPYDEPWDAARVTIACELLAELGVRHISLADTVGIATPTRVANLVAAVLAQANGLEVGVHLHANPGGAADRIRAAYRAGCRRFDAAIGGLGGCPFAQDGLVANVATETLIQVLREEQAEFDEVASLDGLVRVSSEIAATYGA